MVELLLWPQSRVLISWFKMNKEFGDFQTNEGFAEKVCKILAENGVNPDIVIEPTCGEGNFITASVKIFQNLKKVIGIELQEHYVKQSKDKVNKLGKELTKKIPPISIIQDDIFTHEFDKTIFDKRRELLLIGNPPWVTNAELQGKNLPKKSNFKKNNGLDAITGKANFDISEYILLHLLKKFNGMNGHLAFLCKTQVAKNIMGFLPSTDFTATDFKIYLFNAKKEFNVIVDACLFICKLTGYKQNFQCKVFNIDNPEIEIKKYGWFEDKFVSNISKYEKTHAIDGISPLTWRSGLKHDCSKVMELEVHNDFGLRNKLNDILNIEDGLVYPFLKSSDIKGLLINTSRKKVIVTQKKPGEDTAYISKQYPKTWNYLMSHKELFDNRKSVIYKKNPDFSIFGIGEYSFKPYKIAISGFYKNPNFALLIPDRNKPIMVDDSCYILGFDHVKHALIILAVLNSDLVKDFLDSIAFVDAKRPYTKEVLMRINLLKAMQLLGFEKIVKFLSKNDLNFEAITQQDFKNLENEL